MFKSTYVSRLLVLLLLCAIGCSAGIAGAQDFKMRISVDVVGNHNRAKFMQRFADVLSERSKGALKVEVFHSGQLYRDRDVPKALRQGSLEMGCPATWFLSGLDPNLDLFDSSVTYGASDDDIYKLLKTPVGDELNKGIESKFAVKVLGEWFGHESSSTFSVSKPINNVGDLAGLKIRTPGGAGTASIVRSFKATPVQAPWPDVPMALQAGTFDAVITGSDGVVSAKLWDSGIKYAYHNRVNFAFYVPMISQTFWQKLPPNLQKLIVDVWAELRPEGREGSRTAHREALDELAKHGIKEVTPTDAELAQQKANLAATVDIAKETRIDPGFAKRVAAAIN